MDCPVCGEKLREVERSGVMVDICPACKGIWLDRGEIDKLLATESGAGRVIPLARERDERRGREEHDDHDHDREHRDGGYGLVQGSSKKKRSSLLGDILGGLGGD
jgi:uncharacterized protein